MQRLHVIVRLAFAATGALLCWGCAADNAIDRWARWDDVPVKERALNSDADEVGVSYYRDGSMRAVRHLRRGVPHGTWAFWAPDGTEVGRVVFDNGRVEYLDPRGGMWPAPNTQVMPTAEQLESITAASATLDADEEQWPVQICGARTAGNILMLDCVLAAPATADSQSVKFAAEQIAEWVSQEAPESLGVAADSDLPRVFPFTRSVPPRNTHVTYARFPTADLPDTSNGAQRTLLVAFVFSDAHWPKDEEYSFTWSRRDIKGWPTDSAMSRVRFVDTPGELVAKGQ